MEISPIIQPSQLLKLYKSEHLVLVDARNGKDARRKYTAKHIKGARFVDVDTQLAAIGDDPSIGGRHPLPKIDNFRITLSDLGISKTSHIIIYDDKYGSNAAARFWWMLKAVGHRAVQVLDGGIQNAENHRIPMGYQKESFTKAALYDCDNWNLPQADINEVENRVLNDGNIILDVRDTERYNGKTEPIDLIAGHIPGALNIPFTENLDKAGFFLPPEVLRKKYSSAIGNVDCKNVIVHCGSGITACHSILAMAYAGLEVPKLYVGSWSEWSRNNKKIVGMGDMI